MDRFQGRDLRSLHGKKASSTSSHSQRLTEITCRHKDAWTNLSDGSCAMTDALARLSHLRKETEAYTVTS